MTQEIIEQVCEQMEQEVFIDIEKWAIDQINILETSEYPVYLDTPNKHDFDGFMTEEDREEAANYLRDRYLN